MGLLDGDLQAAIYQAFQGRLLKGAVRRQAMSASGALDEEGDPITVEPTLTSIEGFTDVYSAFARKQGGIPETDLKVCIFAGSAPSLVPKKDDQVRFDKKTGVVWYQLRGPVATDPATALWTCQAFDIPAPL